MKYMEGAGQGYGGSVYYAYHTSRLSAQLLSRSALTDFRAGGGVTKQLLTKKIELSWKTIV
jgi:hypothetical protein